jgi:hypothetical protein
LVVFGGQVPPDRKAELREEIGAINPRVIFVQGLVGIPGLIINQVQGAFASELPDATRALTFTPDERSIRLTLPESDSFGSAPAFAPHARSGAVPGRFPAENGLHGAGSPTVAPLTLSAACPV